MTDGLYMGGFALIVIFLVYLVVLCVFWKNNLSVETFRGLSQCLAGAFVSLVSVYVWVLRQDYEVGSNANMGGSLQGSPQHIQTTIVQHVRADKYIGISTDGDSFYLSLKQTPSIGSIIGFVCTPTRAHRPEVLLGGWSLDFVMDEDERFQRWLAVRGLRGSCFVNSFTILGVGDIPYRYNMRLSLQRSVLLYIDDPLYRSLLLGSTIGDASQFSKEGYQQFVDGGLVHLLVVSGGNIAILLTIINMLFVWIPIRLRWLVCIGAVLLYTYVCGADSSIFRACVMSIITLVAVLFGRSVNMWRLLGYAAIVLLCSNPYFLVYDLGFLLSFGAVAGICLRSRIGSTRNALIGYISPLRGAIYGTLPVLIFLGSGWNVASIFANICVEVLYAILYLIICLQGVSLLLGGRVGDAIQFCGAFVSKTIFLVAERSVRRGVRIGSGSPIYKYIFCVIWYLWGILVYIGKSHKGST